MKWLEAIWGRCKQRRQAREQAALTRFKARYHAFRVLLENNGKALELIANLDGQLHRTAPGNLRIAVDELLGVSTELVDGLNLLTGGHHASLYAFHGRLGEQILAELRGLEQAGQGGTMCIGLDDPEATILLQAGAKAANLARLRQMRLPVPDGFVCTVRACKKVLYSEGLSEEIRPLLRDVETGRLQPGVAAAHIRESILATPLPPEVAEALTAAYRELAARERREERGGERPLAVSVRSSGASEDGGEHSFAGQFASLLNVRGIEALHDACRQVIASGFSDRVIAYRLNAGLPPFDFDLAVLVQTMVPAIAAGVLLTVDPARPESGRMLISAVPGLGTIAVGGAAPADIYRPLRTLGEETETEGAEQAVEQRIVRKTWREVADPAGGLRREEVPAAEAEQPLLAEESLAQLVGIGRAIEGLEGVAQDVEWAFTPAGLRILQTRPLRLAAASGPRSSVVARAKSFCTGVDNHRQRLTTGEQGREGDYRRPPAAANLPPVCTNLRQKIVVLSHIDASGPTFFPAECRSIHDIVRSSHEMAVLAMFSAGDHLIEEAGGLLRPMDIGVPFSLSVIDLGGGLRRRNGSNRHGLARRYPVDREDVLSVPLAALCDGMTTPGLHWYASSDSSALSKTGFRALFNRRGVRAPDGLNYGLAARDYFSFKVRAACHSVMVVAVCGRDARTNFIRFRFKGGGADPEQSRRRAVFFRQVLERNGFHPTVIDGEMTASFSGVDKERMIGQLEMLGQLLGFSRVLDGVVANDAIPLYLSEYFLAGRFDSLEALAAMETGKTAGSGQR